jgi:hypothetical protein
MFSNTSLSFKSKTHEALVSHSFHVQLGRLDTEQQWGFLLTEAADALMFAEIRETSQQGNSRGGWTRLKGKYTYCWKMASSTQLQLMAFRQDEAPRITQSSNTSTITRNSYFKMKTPLFWCFYVIFMLFSFCFVFFCMDHYIIYK